MNEREPLKPAPKAAAKLAPQDTALVASKPISSYQYGGTYTSPQTASKNSNSWWSESVLNPSNWFGDTKHLVDEKVDGYRPLK